MHRTPSLVCFAGAFAALSLAHDAGMRSAHAQYRVTNLVSDGTIPAAHTDPNLVNAWGVAFNPTGFVWVSNAATATSTLYNGNGVPQTLVVDIPAADNGPGAPTGIVFSGSPTAFMVTNGVASAPARFIFASLDGTISGWAPAVPAPPPSTDAFIAVDDSGLGAQYTGLAIATTTTGPRLYAVDVVNKTVRMYDATWNLVGGPDAFVDPTLPEHLTPFNAAAIGGSILVAYEPTSCAAEFFGLVNEFDLDGNFVRRVTAGGPLLGPWGMALAPQGFGPFSGALLVGNLFNGTIHAFDLASGDLLGELADAFGNPLVVDGLWGMAFGNGVQNQPVNTLFVAAGPDFGMHGLYARIDALAPGDLNGDGVVNGDDLGILLGAWGPCAPIGFCQGDINGDGVVDAADLGTLLAGWSA